MTVREAKMQYLKEITLDANIWEHLSRQDTDLLYKFLQKYGIRCLLSTPVRTELLCHVNDRQDKDFLFCKGAIRKIVRLCARDTILAPEVEFLKKIGFNHYINPEWEITNEKAKDDFIILEEVANSNKYDIFDTSKSIAKKRTDTQSFVDLIKETKKPFHSNTDEFWCKFLEFFVLARATVGPTHGKTLYKDLTDKEQEIFRNSYDFVLLFNHLDHIIKSIGHQEYNNIDGNHVYDTLQLLLLGDENRVLITDDGAFYRSREKVLRIMRWEEFKREFI
jgi:hypothetical protein